MVVQCYIIGKEKHRNDMDEEETKTKIESQCVRRIVIIGCLTVSQFSNWS